MKALKIILIIFVVYAGIVALFESLLGYFQPANENTLVITTTDSSGTSSDRVLSRIEFNGKTYVGVNHWPRAWYRKVLANPEVSVTINDETGAYLATKVESPEHEQVESENQAPFFFRVLTGFPPRYFVRLDPR